MAGDRFAVLNVATGNLEIKADGATIAISTLNLSVALTLTYGGTGAALTANTGGIVYSGASALAILSGTATANKVLMSGATAAPTWSVPTYPNASVAAGKIIISDATNYVASTPTHPTAATLGKVIIGDGTNWVLSTPTYPNAAATAGKVIIGDGTNYVASTPTYPNAATPTAGKVIVSDGTNWTASVITYPNSAPSAGKILRGDGSNYLTSTFTIVDTMAISTLLYANTANVIQALPTANNGVLITGATGVPSIGAALPDAVSTSARQTVAQALHGFIVGDVLKFAGGVYAKAQADTAANAEVVGMCSNVIGVGNFMLCSNGYVSGLSGLTANTLYYLSGSSAGALTATAPTTEGYINKPVFFATSTTAGYFINYRGVAVTTSTSYYQAFVNGDLAAGILTVNHNLGHKYCTVQVFDNSDIAILPDTITLSSTTALAIDLTSYGVIAGTWHAVVLDIGSTLSTPVAVTSGGTGLATIAAGAIPYASALNTIAALGIGAANLKMFVNAAGTLPEWASGVKVSYFLRDISLTSSLSITGVGFKPSAVLFIATVNSTKAWSVGFADASQNCLIGSDAYISADLMTYDTAGCIYINTVAGANYNVGALTTMDADGFTIGTWNKNLSPTGNAYIMYLAFR